MLSKVMGEGKIILQQSPENWEEAISAAAAPLLRQDYIEPRYITAMIDSVKAYGAYIVIAKGVALAHARSEDGVRKMGLSVMTLKDPVNFGNKENDPVEIIFCLAAPDASTHLDVMRAMVHVIDEAWKINVLKSAASIPDFMAVLNRLEVPG